MRVQVILKVENESQKKNAFKEAEKHLTRFNHWEQIWNKKYVKVKMQDKYNIRGVMFFFIHVQYNKELNCVYTTKYTVRV